MPIGGHSGMCWGSMGIPKPQSGRIAVKVIDLLRDEAMQLDQAA
jgi:hypothetical protein